jgi:hypothetical protein
VRAGSKGGSNRVEQHLPRVLALPRPVVATRVSQAPQEFIFARQQISCREPQCLRFRAKLTKRLFKRVKAIAVLH